MNAQDERTEVEDAIAAWESRGPTSLTVALMADALYGVRERDHEARHVSPDDCMLAGCTIPRGEVRHTCDNRACVNPGHLLVGTGKDNAQDALDRGRYRRGEQNGRAKLTAQQVDEIRRGWAGGETQASMSRRFGVSKSAIQWILNGRNWA